MRSPRRALYEQAQRLLNERSRYVNLKVAIRVFRRDLATGLAIPGDLLPRVWGGVWDTWGGKYVDDPEGLYKPAEISVHPGQVPFIDFDEPGVSRVLLLGAPGGGKTETIVIKAILDAITTPGKVFGLAAPTANRVKIVLRKAKNVLHALRWSVNQRKADGAIDLPCMSTLQFVAAKRHSEAIGSPLAGYDFWKGYEDEQQNIDDESTYEMDARGRQNAAFQVFSSATNERISEFQQRLEVYKNSNQHRLLRMRGDDNVFVPLEHWDKLRERWPKDEYERRILGMDTPCPDVVYPQFAITGNVAPLPMLGKDITAKLVQEKFQNLYDREYILGTDLGILVTTSIVLKAFAMANGMRCWFAVDEITTGNATAEYHAEDIKRWCSKNGISPEKLVVIADPHSRQAERKSDYTLLRKAGLTVVKSSANQIERKHRYNMVNSLLCDAKGLRLLFVACDTYKRATCKRLVDSFFNLRFGADGNPNTYHKGTKDLTHWTDALGYGLYPFEQIRGTGQAYVVTKDEKKWAFATH